MRLRDALRRSGDRLVYEYDLGDGWEHEVVLEEKRRDWAGQFDAEDFDVAEANRRIRRHAGR